MGHFSFSFFLFFFAGDSRSIQSALLARGVRWPGIGTGQATVGEWIRWRERKTRW